MKNNPIEDISIDRSYNTKKRKKGNGLIIIILFLLVILIAIAGLCFYLLNNSNLESNKEVFLKNISNTNVKYFLENELYDEIIKKLENQNSEVTNNIKFSTTISNEFFNQFDISKFSINTNSYSDVKNTKFLNELNLLYLDNNLINFKIVNNEKQIAIGSDEIINKYIGVNYENIPSIIKKISNTEIKFDDFYGLNFYDIVKEENISLDSTVLKKYYDIFVKEISEDKFSNQDNIIITRENDNVEVKSYTLNLSQNELNEVIKKMLIELKDDDSLIEKLVTENDNNSIKELETNSNSILNLDPIVTSMTNETENITEVRIPKVITANEVNSNIVSDNNTENEEKNSDVVEDLNVENNSEIIVNDNIENKINEQIDEIQLEEKELNEKELIDLNEMLIHILTKKKINTTKNNFKKSIDNIIEEIDSVQGNGLIITIYVSKKQTEKINIVLPDSSNLDIEFYSETENNNKIKITWLDKKNEKNNKGYEIELTKIKNDAVISLKSILNFIENNEINRNISINLDTEGSVFSKNFKNDILIKYSDKNGEFITTIDNNIKIDSEREVLDLNEDNCLFLDYLDDENLKANVDAIIEKSIEVYKQKIDELDLINTNTNNSVVEQNEVKNEKNDVTRSEVKQKLISTVSDMMRDKLDNNSNLTIKDLEGLQIEGYDVKTSVTSNLAIITINGYTFHIDSDFNLSDAE